MQVHYTLNFIIKETALIHERKKGMFSIEVKCVVFSLDLLS